MGQGSFHSSVNSSRSEKQTVFFIRSVKQTKTVVCLEKTVMIVDDISC